jgi:hypothetical protein
MKKRPDGATVEPLLFPPTGAASGREGAQCKNVPFPTAFLRLLKNEGEGSRCSFCRSLDRCLELDAVATSTGTGHPDARKSTALAGRGSAPYSIRTVECV